MALSLQTSQQEVEEELEILLISQPGTSSDFQDDTQLTTSSQSSQSSSVPEQEVSVWVDEIELQQQKRTTLNEAIHKLSDGRISPVLSTLNASWDDISVTQQKYYSRKAKEIVTSAFSVISPGQEEHLWESIKQGGLPGLEAGGSIRPNFDGNENLVDALVKAYVQAESWQTKRQILSLFANDFSRSELQQMIPGLSKWRIDQARLHATQTGKGQPVPAQPQFHQRIAQAKVDHFIEFISRPEFTQDVAFGTKTMKLDSGEKIIIPAVIRTLIPSRIITQYTDYCQQQEFQPASDRSLWRMLEVCSASMQTSLQGLDNLTAEGTEAFDNMMKTIDTLVDNGAGEKWGKDAQSKLREGKRYLKAGFKAHIGINEHCKDHCIVYALSDPKDKAFKRECQHKHDVLCESCESLRKVLQDISLKAELVDIAEEQQEIIKFEVAEYIRSINAWKSHLLRLINQDEAKHQVLNDLKDDACLIVMDWAMKYLPQHYRERMTDFYGKRGKSWHVSAVITKKDGVFQVECYVHLFDSCGQDAFAVVSIVENLFHVVRKDYPTIKKAYIRSDNAGCYHNGALLLSLPYIAKRTGILPLRYDFSDPQAGKDICDRKIAPMKGHMRRYVNEKHDIKTAEDMKDALESRGGTKGCRAAVAKVNPLRNNGKDNKIPGISLLNNFSFEEDGIRAWRSFKIGPGRLIKYKELQIEPQQETGLELIQEFGPRKQDLGVIAGKAQDKTSKHDIYSCSETECVLTFKTKAEAEAHMDTDKHVRKTERESMYDSIRKTWAEKVTGVKHTTCKAPGVVEESNVEEHSDTTPSDSEPKIGWALKTSRAWTRMGEKARQFLVEQFDLGAVTGQKADPTQLSREMKRAKDEHGKALFKPEEWRTADQIKSFFSRLSAKQRKQQVESDECAIEEELTEEDIEAIQAEESFYALRDVVVQDMEGPDHPVLVGERNICQLLKNGKLNSLRITDLRSICESLSIEIQSGSEKRKKTYIEPIEEYIQGCSCMQETV